MMGALVGATTVETFDGAALARRIEAAPAHGTIQLPEGRIQGSWSLKRSIRLIGAGSGRTILQASPGEGLLSIDAEDGNVHLEGLTLTGGQRQMGGAICMHSDTRLVVKDCRLADNSAPHGRGGAIYATNGLVALLQCELVDNHAVYGGAIFIGERAEAALRHCWVACNFAERGGALAFWDGAQVRIEDTRLEENQAVRRAHHMYMVGNATRRPNILLRRVIFGEVSAEGARIVNDSDFQADIELEQTEWPDDSTTTFMKNRKRKLTLH